MGIERMINAAPIYIRTSPRGNGIFSVICVIGSRSAL